MSVSRIASRYAKSLIDLAQEQNQLDRILEDINAFQKAVDNRDFYLLLKSPIINATKKQQILDTLFSESFDKMTMSFIRIILSKAREAYLPEIANEFVIQYKAIKHISTVRLTTASPLSEGALENIKGKLLQSSSTEDQVEIETKVDPNLIGGFIIEFDDKLYDASVSHRIEMLKKEFSKNLFVKDF